MNEWPNQQHPPPLPVGCKAAPFHRQGRLIRKVLPSLAVFLALGIVGVRVGFVYMSRDIPLPDTKDLIQERMALLPEQNAFTYFVAATNSFYWPTNAYVVTDYLDGKPVDEALVQEAIVRNGTAMKLIQQGLGQRVCLTPEVTGIDTSLSYLAPWRAMGRVMALKSRHDRLAGRPAEATGTCLSLLRFGNLLLQDAEGLINYLLGIVVLDLGVTQAQDLARDKGTPPEDLTRLSAGLADLGPFDRGAIRAIKGEYKNTAMTIDQFRDGKFGGTCSDSGNMRSWMKRKRMNAYVFQPNKTKLIFANYDREMIRNARLPYAGIKHSDVKEAFGLNESRVMLMIRPNAMGRLLCGLMAPSLDSFFERKCRVECSVAAARLLVACNAYRKAEGSLPDALQSLVPKYLTSIPADPYDGQPFRYSLTEGIVYSVGKDLKDSSGSSKLPVAEKEDNPSRRRWLAEDVVFEINEPIEQPPEDPKGVLIE
jgi:hypothetical protein